MATCIVCHSQYFPQSWNSPAESCDCGYQVDAERYRQMTDERAEIARAIAAWPSKCWKCFDKGEIVAGTLEEHDSDPLCDNCRTNAAEAAHERFLEDYYGGSGPVTLQEQYDAAATQKREQR